MTDEEFYHEVSVALGIELPFIPQLTPRRKSGRWNRRLGNGRIPGWGLVRRFGPNNIHVMSKTHGIAVFTSETECLEWLRNHRI